VARETNVIAPGVRRAAWWLKTNARRDLVESAWGAVLGLLPTRFPRPLAEPAVPLGMPPARPLLSRAFSDGPTEPDLPDFRSIRTRNNPASRTSGAGGRLRETDRWQHRHRAQGRGTRAGIRAVPRP
jgi:hypothetical protein